MADTKMLHTKAEVVGKGIEADEGVINAIVGSSSVLDRLGDVIDQAGWQFQDYKKNNPVILWGHNVREDRPPIGKAIKVWLQDKGKKGSKLMFKVKFDLQDNFAKEIYRKIKDGFINAVSVGFKPLEWEELDADNPYGGRRYVKQELLELSFVPVPANPEALIALKGMKDKRFAPVKIEDLYDSKEDKAVKDTEEKVPETTEDNQPNDEPSEKPEEEVTEEKIEIEKIKLEEDEVVPDEESPLDTSETTDTVVPEEKPEEEPEKVTEPEKVVEEEPKVEPEKSPAKAKNTISFKDLGIVPDSSPWDGPGEKAKAEVSDLKLMCAWYDSEKADVKSSYKLPHHEAEGHKCVWRGVAAAMAALLGARGGAEIPESDRKSVYKHLKKHYKQFDKDIPKFKAVKDQVLAGFDEEIHALILDRGDRYTVRLIKKVLKRQTKVKAVKVEQVNTGYTPEQVKSALKVIDLALSKVLVSSLERGENKG